MLVCVWVDENGKGRTNPHPFTTVGQYNRTCCNVSILQIQQKQIDSRKLSCVAAIFFSFQFSQLSPHTLEQIIQYAYVVQIVVVVV